MKSVAFMIVIASSGRISFPLHAWLPGSCLCQLTQTRYQLTQMRHRAFTAMKSVAFMIVIALLASSGRIDFVPFVFMAIRFAFVSADTNAIPADTNAIRRMLVYPHQ